MNLADVQLRRLDTFGEVSEHFKLGSILKSAELNGGLVNSSYEVLTTQGKFVFQQLSQIFDERVIEDYQQVQSYLRTNGLFVPVLLTARDARQYYKNEENRVWRVFEYLDHDQLTEMTPETAYEAAKLLGKFHRIMSTSDFQPKFALPGFHDTPQIIEKLRVRMNNPELKDKAKAVHEEYRFIAQNIERFYLPKGLSKIIIHGDPKFNNILFKNSKAIALLDLDTMMQAPAPLDLGDGFRSWCRKKPSTAIFRRDIFQAAMLGYNETGIYRYSESELKNNMGLLTLELSARYLTDYFDENYFAYNLKYSTRAQQNLTRTRRYLEYFKNFMRG